MVFAHQPLIRLQSGTLSFNDCTGSLSGPAPMVLLWRSLRIQVNIQIPQECISGWRKDERSSMVTLVVVCLLLCCFFVCRREGLFEAEGNLRSSCVSSSLRAFKM